MKKLIFGILLVSLFIISKISFGSDISGTWEGYIKSKYGKGSLTLYITQDDNTFSGTHERIGGEGDIEGTIKGRKIIFTLLDDADDDCPAKCTGKGTLSKDENTIKISMSCLGCNGRTKVTGEVYKSE